MGENLVDNKIDLEKGGDSSPLLLLLPIKYNFLPLTDQPVSICPYVFSGKMFVKSYFFVYSHLQHSCDEKKRDCIFF